MRNWMLLLLCPVGISACVSSETVLTDEGGDTDGSADSGVVIEDDVGLDSAAPADDVDPDAPVCADPRRACNGVCVDIASNVNHCGECGNVCETGQVCNGGTCAERCAEGLAQCLGECVDLDVDESNCGACATECRASEECVDGRCESPCGANEERCGGRCVDVDGDRYNCGGCGQQCPAGQFCEEAGCVCPGDEEPCDGECVDSDVSEAHCGGCGVACDALETCVDGLCQCPEGSVRCDGACVDVDTNPLYCGSCVRACEASDVCIDGDCQADCPGDLDACGGACVDLLADFENCGECGATCPSGLACIDGECGCPEGTTRCGDACRDLDADEAACGSCSTACAVDEVCVSGDCVCADGEQSCGGACVDTTDDSRNCGRCGVLCNADQSCRDSRCVCAGDLTLCDGECVDLAANGNNCGACAAVCAGTQVCLSGECVASCPVGTSRCGDACVDLGTSINHCGRCDNVCTGISICSASTCVCDADAFEPNDSIGAARRVPTGDLETSTYRGTYLADLTHCSGDVDVFGVEVPLDGGTLDVESFGDCTAGALRQRIELIGAADAVIASSTSGGAGACARLSRALDEGFYRVRVVSLDSTAGRYGLDIALRELREKDDNNDRAAADARGSFARSTTIAGAIDHGLFGWGTDSDWYRFDLAHVSNVRLATAANDGSCGFDSIIDLVDATGATIQSDDDGGVGLCSLIERRLVPGTYYAVVRAYNDATEFDYVLDVELPVFSELEPNGTPGLADAFAAGSIGVEGVLQSLGDRDWYRVSLPSTARVTVSSRGIAGVCDTDTYIYVYESDGTTLLASDDDDGEELCSMISPTTETAFAALPAGDYYVVVAGYSDGRRGSYYLNVIVQ